MDLLSSHLDVLSCKEEEGIYKIYTSKYIIHIYKSGQNRVENVSRAIIHLDIDLLQHSPIKILNRLKGLHGLGSRLYARKTVVARIDKKVALNFQEEHHLQLAIPGKYRYGLFYEGDLVSIAIFSGGRHMRDQEESYRSFELLRFCHKTDSLVVGGLSKLIKAFVTDFDVQDIMTYADLDWTQDSSLSTLGFEVISVLQPQEFYVVNGVRKQVLSDLDKDYYKVKNSGSLKLKLKF